MARRHAVPPCLLHRQKCLTWVFAAADQLLASSPRKPSEYSSPILGLIFLRYAEAHFAQAQHEIAAKGSSRRQPGRTDY